MRIPSAWKAKLPSLTVVPVFPAGGKGVAHPLLMFYAGLKYLVHVGVSLRVSGYVGQQLFVAPVVGIDRTCLRSADPGHLFPRPARDERRDRRCDGRCSGVGTYCCTIAATGSDSSFGAVSVSRHLQKF
jgi:hypothetical protein